jgi:bacteriocin-like protein
MSNDIRELSFEELNSVSGGNVLDRIVDAIYTWAAVNAVNEGLKAVKNAGQGPGPMVG